MKVKANNWREIFEQDLICSVDFSSCAFDGNKFGDAPYDLTRRKFRNCNFASTSFKHFDFSESEFDSCHFSSFAGLQVCLVFGLTFAFFLTAVAAYILPDWGDKWYFKGFCFLGGILAALLLIKTRSLAQADKVGRVLHSVMNFAEERYRGLKIAAMQWGLALLALSFLFLAYWLYEPGYLTRSLLLISLSFMATFGAMLLNHLRPILFVDPDEFVVDQFNGQWRTSFINCKLNRTKFAATNEFRRVLFIDCEFEESVWKALTFYWCRFVDINFSNISFSDVTFSDCQLDRELLEQQSPPAKGTWRIEQSRYERFCDA